MSQARPVLFLVDDEADILVALEDLFEDQYETFAFTAPTQALEALRRRHDVAVIVSDQRMPGMTGDAFLAEARELSDASAILLTGYAELTAVTGALNRGGIVGYASKPWEPAALRAMVAGAAEQHHLRRALRREQGLLRGLVEHLPYAVTFKDGQGRITKLNGRKAQALGRPEAECLGRTEADLLGAPAPEAELEAFTSRRPVQVVKERPGAAGSSWTQLDYVPLIGRGGEVETLVVMERDITEQRLAEQQLRQSDKLRALGTLAGGVAHDFNNLLTAIVGSLELATKRVGDPAAVRRYLDNATLAAQRGASLTQRLLGFSRRTDNRATTIDTAAALHEMRDLLARTLGGVEVEWRIDDELWPSSVEADQLEVAVLNLAINARDAMINGGVITIEARNVSLSHEQPAQDLAPGDYVALTISDTGAGMPPAVLERVLEPFFTTKPVGKGTGLGLAMVYGFAQRSGGGISIKSELGVGTKVTLYLPRGDAEPPASSLQVGRSGATPRGRILVIDDEPGVRSVTAASLRDLGHEVFEADSGEAGLKELRLRPEALDLMLVDYAMPHMNGIEFLEAAKRVRGCPPAILLTGYFDVEAVPDDVRLMHKPFTQSTLEAAVGAVLSPQLAPS